MKPGIALILMLLITMLSGCQIGKDVKPSEMDPKDLPDERAFQDEFTREFLQSVEETKPGYYPFLSKTGKYKMDFPAGGLIDKFGYTINKTYFEFLDVGIKYPDQTGANLTISYNRENKMDNIENHLRWFQGRLGEPYDLEKYEEKTYNFYYTGFERSGFSYQVAYIQNKKVAGGIELIYFTECQKNNCQGQSLLNKQDFFDWIKTIQFIDD
ncbi:hypothetical protein GGQ92_001629 [Gracilibacillus halotolerans]|uniref:Lipoprotein n=1 Tax=Gracilibacillus halotolerans TaxID=74386 RepID=A0A841RFI4_9BACI|nr:hypothetical protein [Gracilibacillus halotolerans]MBB6512840.1 hypothetical protein [Gracilibacillus halotolerans]